MKILFIAYYFEPFPGVGSKRISYWAKHLKRVDYTISKCDVITATPQTKKFDNIDNVFYVENTNQGLLKKFIRFDKGASWLYDIKKFIKNNIQENEYDFVILTGDPFLHFFILNNFRRLRIKTILDFRDPFANNPRGIKNDTLIKKLKNYILRKIENYFLLKADYIITVNEYCVELFENYRKYIYKIKIIDNGYDEQFFSSILRDEERKISKQNIIKITYAGKLYNDRNPEIFFKCLQKYDEMKFYHIGEKSEYIKENSEKIYSLGFMSYENTLKNINFMDICMIFTSGYEFESTTKIFDYIALNKIIFIITDGNIKTGQLHNITKDYPQIYWAKNTNLDIEKVLNQIRKDFVNKDIIKFNPYSYSREIGLKKLINILKEKYDK